MPEPLGMSGQFLWAKLSEADALLQHGKGARLTIDSRLRPLDELRRQHEAEVADGSQYLFALLDLRNG